VPDSHGWLTYVYEDEAPLRELVARVLTASGYRVLAAATGEEAMALAQSAQVDLLLTDVVMPGVSGPELADRITMKSPSLTVLYMSGYDSELVAAKVAAGANFLQKPFTPKSLLTRVAELLGAQRNQGKSPRGAVSKDLPRSGRG